VRELCDKYDLPYTTGSLGKQYLLAFRTIHKLALPDRYLRRTADDAPETSSERKFAGLSLHWPGTPGAVPVSEAAVDPDTGARRGLRSALTEAKIALRERAEQEKQALRETKAAQQEKRALREATQALHDKAREEQRLLRRRALRERGLWRVRRRQRAHRAPQA
jgi:hypothetical protein